MKTILVVDDEFVILELLMELLMERDYEVITARNGREALEKLAQVHVDIILCDVMMPIMDGSQFCRALQANPAYRDIPVIFTSALGDSVLAEDCRYTAFLNKPFDIEVIETF